MTELPYNADRESLLDFIRRYANTRPEHLISLEEEWAELLTNLTAAERSRHLGLLVKAQDALDNCELQLQDKDNSAAVLAARHDLPFRHEELVHAAHDAVMQDGQAARKRLRGVA